MTTGGSLLVYEISRRFTRQDLVDSVDTVLDTIIPQSTIQQRRMMWDAREMFFIRADTARRAVAAYEESQRIEYLQQPPSWYDTITSIGSAAIRTPLSDWRKIGNTIYNNVDRNVLYDTFLGGYNERLDRWWYNDPIQMVTNSPSTIIQEMSMSPPTYNNSQNHLQLGPPLPPPSLRDSGARNSLQMSSRSSSRYSVPTYNNSTNYALRPPTHGQLPTQPLPPPQYKTTNTTSTSSTGSFKTDLKRKRK